MFLRPDVTAFGRGFFLYVSHQFEIAYIGFGLICTKENKLSNNASAFIKSECVRLEK